MGSATKTTKDKIRETAWKLFLDNGYEETSLEDILKAAGTSRSNFYHHFRSKEEILFQMAYYFDENYADWENTADKKKSALEKLIAFDLFTSRAVEDSGFRPFLNQLYGLEVMTKGERYILSENRKYYKTVRDLVIEGQKSGEITNSKSANDIAHQYAGLQRGIVYSWLLEGCQYSLSERSQQHVKLFVESLRDM